MKRQLIAVTAPSAAGKTSIANHLISQHPELSSCVSVTTRKRRANEEDGVDYHFIDHRQFQWHIEQNDFVEWEMVYDSQYYGTLKYNLEQIWKQNKVPVLVLDVKGTIHLQQRYDDCLSIFVQPPSLEVLSARLRARGTESEESLQTRLGKAAYELSFKDSFDAVIINDTLGQACDEASNIVAHFLKAS